MKKRVVGIGHQDFEKLRMEEVFYIDKTYFIKEWWESKDVVTLITRPRRFGKTLNMSMLNCFFSNRFLNRSELFEGLSVWKEEEYRSLQGSYPVIFLSFANIKETNYEDAIYHMGLILQDLYREFYALTDEDVLTQEEKEQFRKMTVEIEKKDISIAIQRLSGYLYRYYGKKVIILLDEYDTPMQEAYVHGYWEELVSLMRNLFNSTFKTNPYLERAVMTGITRVSRESMFSDLNNLNVVTTTSKGYADAFGFTEQEVFTAMDEYGYENKEEVKFWYDGFVFGDLKDIYNPWSIINFLKNGECEAYWVNTSSNGLASTLIRSGNQEIKEDFEDLLMGKSIFTKLDKEIVFSELKGSTMGVFSLLVASGYVKILSEKGYGGDKVYEITLTNFEVSLMFQRMVEDWFRGSEEKYNGFIKALLSGDLEVMNYYMNDVALETFSSFDVGNKASKRSEPERFYHGFVLGLLVELKNRYELRSNRESGFGRYDVMLIPKDKNKDGMILEFKVHQEKKEKDLSATVQEALRQIEEKKYEQELVSMGVPKERIRKYGFAFRGKEVLIGESAEFFACGTEVVSKEERK